MSDFKRELQALLNRVNAEGGSDTPDFVLAEYLSACLDAFDKGVLARERWYNRTAKRGDRRPGFVDPAPEEAKPRKIRRGFDYVDCICTHPNPREVGHVNWCPWSPKLAPEAPVETTSPDPKPKEG